MDTEILNVICTLVGTALGACGTHLFKSGRRKAAAEADRAIIDNYEARLEDLHKVIDLNNDNEIRHAKRVVELNKALDDKTALIRDLNARIFDTQQQNAETLKENTELKLQLAREKCGTYDCVSRQPPTEDTRRAIAAAKRKRKSEDSEVSGNSETAKKE